MRQQKEYAVYKGDTLLALGTAKECAEELGCRPETIKYYMTPAYKRKLSKRKNPKNFRTVIRLEEEE